MGRGSTGIVHNTCIQVNDRTGGSTQPGGNRRSPMTCRVSDHSHTLARCVALAALAARFASQFVSSVGLKIFNMWTQPQRPAVLVIFSEDSYRGAANYQLDLKFPPQYIPKQYRSDLIMDMGPEEAQCNNVATSDSIIIPLRSPTEQQSTPRRQVNSIRDLISGYWSPASCFSTNSGPTCRICFEGNKEEDLISPCDCCGTLKLVHRSCLEKWLSTSNTKNCEVCKHCFDVQHERRPIWKWLISNDAVNGPHGFYADLICVLVLSSMCIGSVYMCALGAAEFIKVGSWKGPGLLLLCVSLSTLCLLFLFVTFKFHWAQMRRWQTSNQLVHLVQWNTVHREPHEKNESVSITRVVSQQNSQGTITHGNQQPGDPILDRDCSSSSFTTIDLESSFTNLDEST